VAVRVIYIVHGGRRVPVFAETGLSVMEAALRNNVPGIVAECGGACSCATCHVYVDPAWMARLGKPDVAERDMIEFAKEPRPNSRLSCQISLSEELDGLVVTVADVQG